MAVFAITLESNSSFLQPQFYDPYRFMEQQTPEPQPPTLPSTYHYATRHDGWTGEKMATFCEALAETAIVADACEIAHMGMSGAYAARRRIPVFAAAWEAALSIARERLADTLLERAMTGTRELYFKDGEVVGERHSIDNRLGLQILRRLDRLSENSMRSCEGRSPVPTKTLGPCVRRGTDTIDWHLAMEALRTGDDEGVAKALALVDGREVEEVEGDPNLPLRAEEDQFLDLSERCWRDDDLWLTDFPPPAGFTGYECRPYDEVDEDEPYERACTPDEVSAIEASEAADRAAERAEDEMLRDEWFALLRGDGNTSSSRPHSTPPARRSGHA
jgi:hypothetical protein